MTSDPFAPLPAHRSLGVGGTNGKDAPAAHHVPTYAPGGHVMPIPARVPAHPLTHPEFGDRINRVYDYNDASGRMLFRVFRFEPGDGTKHYRPLTLWQGSDGKLAWRWAAPPAPRPLYGLDELGKRRPEAPVLIVEGEKAAKNARKFMQAYVVMTSMGGAKAAAYADWTALTGRKVTIWPDADEPGRAYAQDVAACLARAGAAEIRIVQLDRRFKDGWDLGDWGFEQIKQPVYSVRELHRMVDEAPRREQKTENGDQKSREQKTENRDRKVPPCDPRTPSAAFPPSDPCIPSSVVRSSGISGLALQSKTFAPIKWIVPDVIVEGLTLIAGKPKLGKSWMALNLGLAVAAGGRAFSTTTCDAGDVLALALEDNERRLQARVQQMLGDQPWPGRITFHTEWPRLDEGGLEAIDAWVRAAKAPKLVIIDVLAKVRGRPDGKKTLYTDDFEQLAQLQRLASARRLGIAALHHASKRDNPEDPFDLVSGTTGLTAAADSVLVLRKEAAQADAVLYGRGRDLPVFEKALRFDGTRGLWAVLGDADEYRVTTLEGKIIKELACAPDPMSPKDLAPLIEAPVTAVKSALYRMAKANKAQNLGGKFAIVET